VAREHAVLPCVLEPELERAVRQALEPFLCNRRAGDITTEPLELSEVAAVDRLLGVHVDAAVLGNSISTSLANPAPSASAFGHAEGSKPDWT
jgi:hypothetical protein